MHKPIPLPRTAALLSGVALLAAAPALAQQPAAQVSGLYFGAGVGVNWVMDTSLSLENRATTALRNFGVSPAGGDATYQTGVAALGSVGWGFGNGWRVEGEANYRYNDLDSISGFGVAGRGFVGLPPTGTIQGNAGRQQTFGLMANVFYDFQIASAPWMVPYLGAGVGVAWTNLQDTRVNVFPVTPGGPFARMNIGNTQVNFAYQAIAGVAFPIATVPGLAITAEYRFMGTLANDFGATFVSQRTGQTITAGGVRAENLNNSVLVGIRYAVNAPRPVPPPAPAAAPAPARTFLVFFDWDRADLT
nr:outer membrane beta-barrel protein [Rubritepida sp.]